MEMGAQQINRLVNGYFKIDATTPPGRPSPAGSASASRPSGTRRTWWRRARPAGQCSRSRRYCSNRHDLFHPSLPPPPVSLCSPSRSALDPSQQNHPEITARSVGQAGWGRAAGRRAGLEHGVGGGFAAARPGRAAAAPADRAPGRPVGHPGLRVNRGELVDMAAPVPARCARETYIHHRVPTPISALSVRLYGAILSLSSRFRSVHCPMQ